MSFIILSSLLLILIPFSFMCGCTKNTYSWVSAISTFICLAIAILAAHAAKTLKMQREFDPLLSTQFDEYDS